MQMKKIPKMLAVVALCSLFFSCSDDSDTVEYSLVQKIDSPNITAEVFPGVNLVKWTDVNDAGSYSLYRSVNDTETLLKTFNSDSDSYYYDYDIYNFDTTYTYRIVANPVSSQFHNASEAKVSVKTLAQDKLPPAGTSFESLASYEVKSDSKAEVLSSSTIKFLSSGIDDGTILVMFPAKAYASYTVTLIDKAKYLNDSSDYVDDSKTVSSIDNNKTVYCKLTPSSLGDKIVRVEATPLCSSYKKNSYERDYKDFKLNSPENLRLSDDSYSSKVRLSWDSVNFADSYTVYYGTSSSRYSAEKLEDTTSTSVTMPYEDNGTFYFWVTAENTDAGKVSEYSESASIDVTFVARAPSSLTAKVNKSIYSNNITLSWSKTNTDYYTILYGTENDSETAKVLVEKQDYSDSYYSCSYSWDSPDAGTYYFWVKTISKSGKSESELTATEEAVAYELSAPASLSARAKPSSKCITLSWNGSDTGSKYYNIYCATEADFTKATLIEEKKEVSYSYYDSADTYNWSNTEVGTFYFWVETISASGNTKVSASSADPASATYTLTAPANAPSEYTFYSTNSYVALKVYKGTGSDYVNLYASSENDSSTAKLVAKKIYNSSSYSSYTTYYFYPDKTDETAGNNPVYIWAKTVSASGKTESEEFSSVCTLTPTGTYSYKDVPTISEVTKESDSVKLTCTSVSCGRYVWYYASENDSSKATKINLLATSNEAEWATDSEDFPKESGTYYFWVKAASSTGNSESGFSESKSVTW